MAVSPGRREKPAVFSSLPFQAYDRVLRSFTRKRDRRKKNDRTEDDQKLLSFFRFHRSLTRLLGPILSLVSSHSNLRLSCSLRRIVSTDSLPSYQQVSILLVLLFLLVSEPSGGSQFSSSCCSVCPSCFSSSSSGPKQCSFLSVVRCMYTRWITPQDIRNTSYPSAIKHHQNHDQNKTSSSSPSSFSCSSSFSFPSFLLTAEALAIHPFSSLSSRLTPRSIPFPSTSSFLSLPRSLPLCRRNKQRSLEFPSHLLYRSISSKQRLAVGEREEVKEESLSRTESKRCILFPSSSFSSPSSIASPLNEESSLPRDNFKHMPLSSLPPLLLLLSPVGYRVQSQNAALYNTRHHSEAYSLPSTSSSSSCFSSSPSSRYSSGSLSFFSLSSSPSLRFSLKRTSSFDLLSSSSFSFSSSYLHDVSSLSSSFILAKQRPSSLLSLFKNLSSSSQAYQTTTAFSASFSRNLRDLYSSSSSLSSSSSSSPCASSSLSSSSFSSCSSSSCAFLPWSISGTSLQMPTHPSHERARGAHLPSCCRGSRRRYFEEKKEEEERRKERGRRGSKLDRRLREMPNAIDSSFSYDASRRSVHSSYPKRRGGESLSSLHLANRDGWREESFKESKELDAHAETSREGTEGARERQVKEDERVVTKHEEEEESNDEEFQEKDNDQESSIRKDIVSRKELGRRFRKAWVYVQQKESLQRGCFPIEAVQQHPELSYGMPYRRLGGDASHFASLPRPRGASPPSGLSRREEEEMKRRRVRSSSSPSRKKDERGAFLPKERERRQLEELSPNSNKGGEKKEREIEKERRGLLVSGICLGTSMFGSEPMMDDEQGIEMLECAYQQYGINFFDVGELDPIPYAPLTHGRGHTHVLRPFFKRHQAIMRSQSPSSSSFLGHEVREIKVSARILSGGLIGFREERQALLRSMKEEREADPSGDHTAVRYAWGEHDPEEEEKKMKEKKEKEENEDEQRKEEDEEEMWSRDRGWWARRNHEEPQFNKKHIEGAVDDLLLRLGIETIDLLQLDTPHRYVPRHEQGEDTYCWGLERHEDDIAIEEQLLLLQSLIDKGKVRYIGVSNETPWGVFKWCSAAEEMGLGRIASVQALYNLLHRNEFESSGFPEMVMNLNVPLLAYGTLAGGILTSKYLDPERFNPRGADERMGQDEYDSYVSTYRTKLPEDTGYLSYGPANSRCNKWRETYQSHRTVWSQWLMAELVKVSRQYALTATQLALAWVYSRPFIGSAIIGPRTIGQLRESVRALNYPMVPELASRLHEIFLRYRAPTMGGPQVATHLEDLDAGQLISQSEFMKWGRQPIWSGGTYWPNYPQPLVSEKVDYLAKREQLIEVRAAACDTDDPSDEGVVNVRLWKERLEEGRPGEYFAVKEQKLFGWDEKKFSHMDWRNLTTHYEQVSQNHSDFHFVWKGDKIYRENTTEAMNSFYRNKKAICDVMHKNVLQFQDLYENLERTPGLWCSMWNEWDYDLIDKRLREKHNIDLLDKKIWRIVGETPNKKKRERLEFTEPFWYWEDEGQADAPWAHATGEDVTDG